MSTATASKPLLRLQSKTRLNISDLVNSKGSGLPNRYLIYAINGWGKTSFGAQTPKPVFIQGKGETGLETLIDAGLINETPHFPECMTWQSVLDAVDSLIEDQHDFRTLLIDTGNSIERLCFDAVCQRDFESDLGKFLAYGRGPDASMGEWRILLGKLDTLRMTRKMSIIMFAHSRIVNFKNPEAEDYNRYEADMYKSTSTLTSNWADAVLFGNYAVTITTDKDTKRKRGIGGSMRVLCTERTAAYEAKNRLGLPSEIDMGANANEAWGAFLGALKQGRENSATAMASIEPIKENVSE